MFDPPTDPQQFVYLANDLVELLETAKRELERDREAAKASLSTASSAAADQLDDTPSPNRFAT